MPLDQIIHSQARSAPLKVNWWKSLQFSLLLYLSTIILITSVALFTLVHLYIKPQLAHAEYDLHKKTSEAVVYQIQNMMQSAQVIAQSMGEAVERMPLTDENMITVIPALLDNFGSRDLVAGGGIWPQPYALDRSKERASYFWARSLNGNLEFLDDYNRPINPPYHGEEWYVPTTFLKSRTCYWSRTYRDPYSKEPMVTCSVPVFKSDQTLFGVATVDLRLSGIRKMLIKAAESKQGYVMVLDRENRLLSAPEISDRGSIPAIFSKLVTDQTFIDAKSLALQLEQFTTYYQAVESINQTFLLEKYEQAKSLAEEASLIAERSPAIDADQAKLISALIHKAQLGQMRYTGESFTTLKSENDPFLSEPAVASIFVMPETLWKVIVVSPETEVYSGVINLIQRMTLLLLGLGIFILALSYFAIRYRVIRPIHQIVDQLKSNASLPLSIDSNDEIGMVADYINQTTRELRASNERMSIAVDKRERADKLRRLSEMRFKAIARTAPDAIISADSHGAIIDWNPAAQTIFGYRKSEIVGSSYLRLLSANDVREKLDDLRRYLSGQTSEISPQNIELQAIRSNGELFTAEMSCTAWQTERGRYFTIFLRDISERIKAQHALRHQALHDPLTELPNRHLFNDRLAQALKHADRDNLKVGIMLLDLDNFKIVNDTLGHKIGDELLRSVTRRIQREQRASDTIARLGGDEFGVILSNIHAAEEAMYVAERFRGLICEPVSIEENSLQVGVSIGITVYPEDGTTPEVLLRNADMAMYQAKEKGKNACCFFVPEMDEQIRWRQWLQEQMEEALRTDQFDLYLQPLIDIQQNRLAGAEALIRWFHPERGFISPVDFIPIAEHSGFINDISDWVLKRACQYLRDLHAETDLRFPIAINLSAAQFRQQDLIEKMDRTLSSYQVEPGWIECEITETTAMEDVDMVIKILEELVKSGYSVAIDDFGTGYSSLSYLKRFPISKIKIDRSFIQDLGHSEESISIAQAVIEMGHSMNLKVLAEGVEEDAQVDWLRRSGCELVQGYFFSKPLPFDEFKAWASRFQE